MVLRYLIGGIGGRGGAGVQTFSLLGQSSVIAADSVAETHVVTEVCYYRGKWWLGYGSWNVPPGADIDLLYWDGSAFQRAIDNVGTESICGLDVMDDKLIICIGDTLAPGFNDPDYIEVTDTTPVTISKTPPNQHHVLRINKIAGNYYLTGNDGSGLPSVHRSTDGRATWTEVASRAAGGRTHAVCFINGKYWTQPESGNAMESVDGVTWSDSTFRIPDYTAPMSKPLRFGNYVFLTSAYTGVAEQTGNVYRFDGTGQATQVNPNPLRFNGYWDLALADGYLYSVHGDSGGNPVSTLYRTAVDTPSWEAVATIPNKQLHGFDVHDGVCVAGDHDSSLYTVTGLGSYQNLTYLVDQNGAYVMDDAGNFVVAA